VTAFTPTWGEEEFGAVLAAGHWERGRRATLLPSTHSNRKRGGEKKKKTKIFGCTFCQLQEKRSSGFSLYALLKKKGGKGTARSEQDPPVPALEVQECEWTLVMPVLQKEGKGGGREVALFRYLR